MMVMVKKEVLKFPPLLGSKNKQTPELDFLNPRILLLGDPSLRLIFLTDNIPRGPAQIT